LAAELLHQKTFTFTSHSENLIFSSLDPASWNGRFVELCEWRAVPDGSVDGVLICFLSYMMILTLIGCDDA
jgi:hypothetical protein